MRQAQGPLALAEVDGLHRECKHPAGARAVLRGVPGARRGRGGQAVRRGGGAGGAAGGALAAAGDVRGVCAAHAGLGAGAAPGHLGKGRVDVTVGSALDIFGGQLPFADVVEWHRSSAAAAAGAAAAS